MSGDGSSAATFDALADERRVDVVRTLAAAERGADGVEDAALSFSDIYDRVDVDGTSTFSYHLDRLVGTFVRETDHGYRLSPVGRRVVTAMRAGAYDDPVDVADATVDVPCPRCEARPAAASHVDGAMVLSCPDCELAFFSREVPPGLAAGTDGDAAVDRLGRLIRDETRQLVHGLCPECGGHVSPSLQSGVPQFRTDYLAVVDCEQCGVRRHFPPYFPLVDHPAVVAFYWERGVDVADASYWWLLDAVGSGDWRPEVVAEEPFRLRVAIRHAGDELRVTIDGDLSVRAVERVDRHSPARDEPVG